MVEIKRKSGRSRRKLILALALGALCILIAGTAFAAARFGRYGSARDDGVASDVGKYIRTESAVMPFYTDGPDVTAFLCGGEMLDDMIDGEPAGIFLSADGKRAVVLTSGAELYSVSADGVEKIGDEVRTAGIASSGSRAYYIDLYDTLYSVDLESGKAVAAGEDIAAEFGIAVSPNGERMMYCVDTGEGGVILYSYRNGRSEVFAKDFYPVSVSDNGKCVYLRHGEGELYGARLGRDEKIKLSSNVDFSSCKLNADGSEMIFISGGEGYVAENAMRTFRLCIMDSFDVVMPGGCVDGLYLPVRTFFGAAVGFSDNWAECSVGFLKADGKFSVIAKSIESLTVGGDGENVFYRFADGLYMAGTYSDETADGDDAPPPRESVTIAEGIGGFAVSASGRFVYFSDSRGDLVRFDAETSESVVLTVGVDSFAVKGEDVFFIKTSGENGDGESGELYVCDAEGITTKLADGVSDVRTLYPAGLVAYRTDGGAFFVSEDGRTFSRIDL